MRMMISTIRRGVPCNASEIAGQIQVIVAAGGDGSTNEDGRR